ncbi:MAG: hypothetical protein ABFS24_16360, partial [Pseudomonadota bacterium]
MKAFNNIKVRTNGFSGKASVAMLLPFLCALAVSAGPVQAQEEGAGPLQEQHDGMHDHDNMNVDFSGNIFGVDNLAYYGDWNANSIYIYDVDYMRLLAIVDGT